MAADISNSPVHFVEQAVLNGTVLPPVEIPAAYDVDDVVDALVDLGLVVVADA